MAEFVAWACRSPQRLLTVLAVTLIAVLGIGTLVVDHLSDETPGTTTTTPTVSAEVPDAAPFVRTAVEFARLWASPESGQSLEQWHARLAPMVTEDLAAGLRLTDLANLPGGEPGTTPTVRFVSGASALVAVPLTTGTTVLVTVVDTRAGSADGDLGPGAGADPGGTADPSATQGSPTGVWKVSDVQPDRGDYGSP